MKHIILALLCCLASFASTVASAQNYYFLNDATITYFTDEDAKLYAHAQYDALNNYRDGAKVSWNNPNTEAHGYIIPSKTTRKNGNLCRNLTIVNFAEHRSGEATFTFCKIQGTWKVL